MGSFAIVVIVPWLEVSIPLLGVGPVSGVCPLAQSGLDKAFGLAIGSGRVWSGAAVFELHLLAGGAELSGSVAGAIVGEQGADADAVVGEEVHRRVEEADGGLGPLIGQHLGCLLYTSQATWCILISRA